jgi:hypothetical protein
MATLNGFGQNLNDKPAENKDSKKKCGLKLSSIYLNPNKYIISDDFFNSSLFNNNDLQNYDMSQKHNKGGFGSMGSFLNVSQINLGVGFNPYCKKLGDYNKKQEFRVALSYTNGTRSLTDDSETIPYAGVSYVSTSGVIYSDTAKTTRTTTSEKLIELGVDLSYIFRTNQEKMVSLFTGVGLNTGYALISDLYTNISYSTIINYTINGNVINSDDNNNISQKDPKKSLGSVNASILLRPYIPFGINFRLAKTQKFFSKMNLYIQGQAGAEYQQLLDGSEYYIKPLMSMGFGVKYTF